MDRYEWNDDDPTVDVWLVARRDAESTMVPNPISDKQNWSKRFRNACTKEILRLAAECAGLREENERLRAANHSLAADLSKTVAKLSPEMQVRADTAERERDEAVKFIGRFNEEMVNAGFRGGDRMVALENLRQLLRERDDYHYCPVCKIPYPQIDEDGCCVMCGLDCSKENLARAVEDSDRMERELEDAKRELSEAMNALIVADGMTADHSDLRKEGYSERYCEIVKTWAESPPVVRARAIREGRFDEARALARKSEGEGEEGGG